MQKLIYAADDEQNIRNLVKTFLEKDGYAVETFENGDSLLSAFDRRPCDLCILDIMMPGSSGYQVCTELRKRSTVPIIMLTARDSDLDYITGITLGSDDYFTKPFSPTLLVMRVKAILRRIEMDSLSKEAPKTLNFGDISINAAEKTASCGNTPLDLTPNEWSLLSYMLENQGRAVSREELLDKIWGFSAEVETRVSDDTIKRLRKKLQGSRTIIETVWGFGFRLREKAENE